MLSNDVFIHFELEKEIGKILILKKHAERLHSILNPSYPMLTDKNKHFDD